MVSRTYADTDGNAREKLSVPANWVTGFILIACAATMFTTGRGMYTIFGNLLIAMIMTLLVEAVLVATSLMLGRDLARVASGDIATAGGGRGWAGNIARYSILSGTFALAFFICWFFSFNFYYNAMFSGGEDVLEAERQPHQAADPLLIPLRQRVEAVVRDDGEKVLKQPEVSEWLAWIDAIDKQARDPSNSQRLAELLARQNGERIQNQQKTQARIDQLQSQQTELNQSRQQQEGALANRKQDAEKNLASIADLKKQVEDLVHQRDDIATNRAREEARGADGRPAGRGPVWQSLDNKETTLGKRINLIQNVELAPALKRQSDLEGAVAKTEGQLTSTNAQIAKLSGDIANAKALLPVASAGEADQSVVPAAFNQPLVQARDGFTAAPSPETYKTLVDACEQVVSSLSTLDAGSQIAKSHECRSEAVGLAVAPMAQLLQARGEFVAACSAEAVSPRIEAITTKLRHDLADVSGTSPANRRTLLGTALEQTQNDIVIPCLGIAGRATARVDDLEASLQTFVQRHTLRQDSFSQTRNAVFSLLDGSANNAARLGMWIALAQDSFVLLITILGEIFHRETAIPPAPRLRFDSAVDWAANASDPPNVATAKIILRAARGMANGAALLPPDFDAALAERQRDNVSNTIRRLAQAGMVKKQRDGTDLLTREAVETIEGIVLAHGQSGPKLDEQKALEIATTPAGGPPGAVNQGGQSAPPDSAPAPVPARRMDDRKTGGAAAARLAPQVATTRLREAAKQRAVTPADADMYVVVPSRPDRNRPAASRPLAGGSSADSATASPSARSTSAAIDPAADAPESRSVFQRLNVRVARLRLRSEEPE
jgi:hypothetical protein